MSNKKSPATKRLTDDEIIERARRAMIRASDKAMEDYKRFGIEPVLNSIPIDADSKTLGNESAAEFFFDNSPQKGLL